MQIQPVNNTTFGNTSFELSPDTIKKVSKSTGLSANELMGLSAEEALKTMKERGTLRRPSKVWKFFRNIYNRLGEKLGFKEIELPYTDIY